ncbi:MAG: T9SS type A sorting domain-containing protein [Bacteroidetes bacterium]|nr:T9SS type A sorting domain-containing protein [Bacteroidota bacterium]MCL2303057.1 T9SS type A sorting domain-containing protein [Lentimicrobiaceae bacterium]
MKKIIYFFAFSFLLSPFFLNAQFHHQLPDGSFETGWKQYPAHGSFYLEYETNFFYTLNSLFAVPEKGDITARRVGNAQHGSYCIELKSGKIVVGSEHIFLPGMVGTINKDFVEEFIGNGGSVTITKDWVWDTPHYLEGWYQYNPVNGDSALIEIGVSSDYSGIYVLESRIIKAPTSNWTHFLIPIPPQYHKVEFDDIRVLFVASAAINFDDLMACKGQIGSTLWVDNISLGYNYGIKQNLFSTLKAKAFPNPATDILNIELNEPFTGKVMVYNVTGSLIMEENISGTQCQLNTSALATGNYIYKLMEGNTIFAQGKFVVN